MRKKFLKLTSESEVLVSISSWGSTNPQLGFPIHRIKAAYNKVSRTKQYPITLLSVTTHQMELHKAPESGGAAINGLTTGCPYQTVKVHLNWFWSANFRF